MPRDNWRGEAHEAPIRRVRIEGLAPTGEGIARTPEGVGFVAGALPGEGVDAQVVESRRRFWKARAVEVREPSGDRAAGAHAQGCAGCDWAHLNLARARDWKRSLFLETMDRIGHLPREPFGELPVGESPPGYRLRNRFHVSGSGPSAAVGFFAPRTHRVEPAQDCEALGEGMRALLPRLKDAVAASGARVSEIATVESLDGSSRLALVTLAKGADRRDAHALVSAATPLFEGFAVADASGARLERAGADLLWLGVGERELAVKAGTFFQGNRYLVGPLFQEVERQAAAVAPATALDAFGGVGLFAGALLEAGHSVRSVESDHGAVELALAARQRWNAAAWTIAHSSVLSFLERATERYGVTVVDPPRAGLGRSVCEALTARVGERLVYVSCDPATLARDLAILTGAGLAIASASLFDLFAFTHRIEAVVTLVPARR